jgi:choline dehydrogenase-like flavoprotein
MRVDLAAVEDGSVFDADLCIVGAGAAGITIARDLAGSPVRICLLEGGGFEASEASQELYEGGMLSRYTERPGSLDYLRASRLRFFGGSTNHWAGWCRPLDALDFEPRPWVPHSGWPFRRETLEPWYRRAAETCEIPPFGDEPPLPAEGPRAAYPLDARRVATRRFHISPPTRFGERYRREIVEAPNIRLFLDANAVALHADPPVARLDRIAVRAGDGRAFTVRPRGAVLATGGIENARLLLLSNHEQPEGLGNRHDRVGRYFMDHPFVDRAGRWWLAAPATPAGEPAELYRQTGPDPVVGGRSRGVFVVDARVREREQLLHGMVQVADLWRWRTDAFDAGVAHLAGAAATLGSGESHQQVLSATLLCVGEQAPNPESRVTLMEARDRFGLRRAQLDWRLTELDARSVRRTAEIAADALGAALAGRARLLLSETDPWPETTGRSHHMGTTRMHDDPRRGVVDADCRVHGLANLWIAGSSVFPTCGYANPTLTLVALAHRLADRLRRELAP